jgi:multiple sugar transport system substrate-binding protein
MPGDDQVHDIEMKVLPAPQFAGGKKVAVQQGAGMVVTTGTEAQINGAVTFLKWFTEPQNNIAFSVESGYLPVTTAANDMDAIRASGLELTDNMEQILSGAVKTVHKNELYTPMAFAGGSAARKVLDYSMSDQASADRDTVLERIAAGQSAEAAEAEFLTDDYFEAWYQATLAQLQQYEG